MSIACAALPCAVLQCTAPRCAGPRRLEMAAKVSELAAQLAAVKREEQDSFDQVRCLKLVGSSQWVLGCC